MRSLALIGLVVIGCGKSEPKAKAGAGSSPPVKAAERFAKVKQPKVSAVCEKARDAFGYGAECLETALPELTTAAGTLSRVVAKGDATADWTYVLVRPDGTMFAGEGGSNGDILDEVMRVLDPAATPPELLAKLYVALDVEAALVRCLPGTGDQLPPDRDGKVHPCAAPALIKDGDQQVLTLVFEKFAHPRLLNRDDHWISSYRVEVLPHELSMIEGEGLVELPADAPLPKDAPPLPTMTTPPAWVAKPVEAAADVSAALCKAAAERISGVEGRQCKAYAYPSLDLPTGSLYYLANDAAEGNLLAFKKPDGAIVVGFDLEAGENPLKAIVASYDPAVVPPAKLVALHLFLESEPAHILCLPGSGDVIPDNDCRAPTADKQGEDVVITAILEELPFPDGNGRVADPAVRRISLTLTPGGGFSGGGTRLLDLREGSD